MAHLYRPAATRAAVISVAMQTSIRRAAAREPRLVLATAPAAARGWRASGVWLLALYAATMLVSASLLFLVQPMFAKMVLPLLGGSPAVWNTTVVFYQAVLLGGYLYAHATTARLGVRRQAALHVVPLLLPLLVLPIAVPAGWRPPTEDTPIPWLLSLLLVSVGLPFFAVSASSPMLQKWFAASGHRAAADPYFLYAASNVGSLLALISYPLLLEPSLRLAEQSWTWTLGYGLLVILTLSCAATVWRRAATPPSLLHPRSVASNAATERLALGRRLRWVLLAFVPSSLMLSVTTYLSNNIAPIPLLWVIPLGLYLLTFILVFASRQLLPHRAMVRALPILVLPLAIVIIAQATQPIWLLILLHLLTFFVAAMVCHGEIAADRPSTAHLTEFYLWMSLGGVLGGMFNALLAPVLFTTVLEYPLVLVLACLLMPARDGKPARRMLDVGLPLALGVLVAGLIVGLPSLGVRSGPLGVGLMFGLPALVCFSFSRRPLRLGLGLAALFLASALYTSDQGAVLHAERSFFGIHRVLADPDGRFHMLSHGATMHGMQYTDPARRRGPLSYFHRSGPAGQVFRAFDEAEAKQHIAVIGLGAGSLACYAEPGQQWLFYEIDPSVQHIARDSGYFSFLQDCAPQARIVLGDARLSLATAPTGAYDLLVLDAYSSDAIPIHLITREALAVYLDKLAPGGLLVFHISNIYFDLKPVVANLAQDAGLVALVQEDQTLTEADLADGKKASQWAILARTPTDLGKLANDPRWRPLQPRPGLRLWTDDFSSVLSVLR
jgi:SAM-dependent methyltransferase